jgi:hypothetical protein
MYGSTRASGWDSPGLLTRPLERGFERIAISVAGIKGGDGSGWPFAILFLQSVGNSLLRFNQPPTMWQWRPVLAAYHL